MIGRVTEAKLGRIVVEIADDKRRIELAQAFVDLGYATTIKRRSRQQ
ncbi:hypothetical protein [Mesorhizobium sp.]|nr:hypothetical protein [Mesorhizobium sp.]